MIKRRRIVFQHGEKCLFYRVRFGRPAEKARARGNKSSKEFYCRTKTVSRGRALRFELRIDEMRATSARCGRAVLFLKFLLNENHIGRRQFCGDGSNRLSIKFWFSIQPPEGYPDGC